MANKAVVSEELSQPDLVVKREDAQAQLVDRVEKGKELLNYPISNAEDLDAAKHKRKVWHEYNEEFLSRIFSNEKISKHFHTHSHGRMVVMGHQSFYEDVQDYKDDVQRKISNLESILERLPLIPESSSVEKSKTDEKDDASTLLHPLIKKECENLIVAGYYGEAVEKSFKVVRDKLRTLTGHETSSEAFGKGGLFIKGAAASNVEDDFQDAVRFLGMSIDFFRNEKAHTITPNVSTPEQAYRYLILSSLALYQLD
jgi:uncharacterized protein (TIGR02391 family)